MDILWFHLLSVSALERLPAQMTIHQPIEQLSKSLLSASVQSQMTLSSAIFTVYFIVAILIKRASFLGAFLFSCMLMELGVFDLLSEASLYLLTFAIYSYVMTCNGMTFKQRSACGILIILSLTLAHDAYFYGIDGIYGAHETVVYNNIEYLALYAHTIFISTLIPYRRIGNSIKRMLDSVMYVKSNSAYLVIC